MSERINEGRESYLPVVTPEIGKTALQNSEEAGFDHIIAVGQRLADPQPYLNHIISKWAEETAETTEEARKMIGMALLVFELLDSQATADAMKRQFGEF